MSMPLEQLLNLHITWPFILLNIGEEAAIAGSSQAAAAHLGIKLLVSIFGAVPSAQEGLLREIQSKLVGVKEDTSLPFVATLAQLVYKYPKAVLEHAEILKVYPFARQLCVFFQAARTTMLSQQVSTCAFIKAAGACHTLANQ